MRGKIISVHFRNRSATGEIACRDGEIAQSENIIPGKPSSSGSPELTIPYVTEGNGKGSGFRSELPVPPCVEFGLERRIMPNWHNHLSNPPATVAEAGAKTRDGWGKQAMAVLSRFSADASSQNLFTSPFFVIAALRMSDGTKILPGPPVLMTPNSESPEIGGNTDWDNDEMKMTVAAATCALQWRITSVERIKESEGVISHIDVFISEEIPFHSSGANAVCRMRHTPTIVSHSGSGNGICREHKVYEGQFPVAWQPEERISFTKELVSVSAFRHVAEFPVANLKDSGNFSDLAFNCGNLNSLDACETYYPEYAHLKGISAGFSRVVSGRLTVCGLTLTLPPPFLPSQSLARTDRLSENGRERTAVEVETVKNGETLHCCVTASGPDCEYLSEQPPRWVFYPDPDARKLTVVSQSGSWSVKLRKHPSLHGSFYFSGYAARDAEGFSTSGTRLPEDAIEGKLLPTYSMPSGIWRSAINNTLFFPDRLLCRLDIGETMAVCRAFRASGLVATTSPTLYLFTDEGVFLLKEMADGSLHDAGLMGAYILRDPEAFAVCGGCVLFYDTMGNIMRIEGTKITTAVIAGESSKTESLPMPLFAADASKDVAFLTRAIKFGKPEEPKRIAGVELAGTADTSVFSLNLEGSDNLRDWHEVCTCRNGKMQGLWSRGFRYFRVGAAGRLRTGESLEAVLFRLWQ